MTLSSVWRFGSRSVAVAAAIAATFYIWDNLPANTEIYAPFEKTGTVGNLVSGRTLRVVVDGVQAAEKLRVDSAVSRLVRPIGTWVVVEATVSAVYNQQLPRAELTIGDDRYGQTDRLDVGSTLGGPLQPGFLQHGVWVFDVAPSGLKDGEKEPISVQVGSGFESRLDSILDIEVAPQGSVLNPVKQMTVKRPTKAVE